MQRSTTQFRSDGRRRRGFATLSLLFCMTIVIALAALVIDLALLVCRMHQLRIACEASALAGAAHLVDGPAKSDEPHWKAVKRARRAALDFARQNPVGQEPVVIQANPRNEPGGDIVVGTVVQPHCLGAPFFAWTGRGGCNSVLVRTGETEDRGNPFTRVVGRWLGIANIDLQASARATVDQRLYGFRPTELFHAPLVPILISPSDRQPVPDRYKVNRGRVTSGSDGIPEWICRIRPSHDDRGCATLWQLHRGVPDPTEIGRLIRRGFARRDLASVDGELTKADLGRLHLVPGDFLTRPRFQESICRALREIRGQQRIWVLRSSSVAPNGHFARRFVAARLLDCQRVEESGLRLVLQPCSLLTPTGLTRAGEGSAPGIGKLVLTN